MPDWCDQESGEPPAPEVSEKSATDRNHHARVGRDSPRLFGSCTPRAGFWTVKVSWADQSGRSCWQVRIFHHLKPQTAASEHHFRENVVLAQSHASDQAHFRSHSGPGAGAVIHGAPSGLEFPDAASPLPHLGSGTFAAASSPHRCDVRVRWPE